MAEVNTAVLLLNLGGPRSLDEVPAYLKRMFLDRELIPLPFQETLGPFIAARRAPKVARRYAEIGGRSPIYDWTRLQGDAMERLLDEVAPASAPHKAYIAFRYAEPMTETALREIHADGVTRVVAFTQYPQWSCSTTGASLNELWRVQKMLGMERAFRWSVIDRWPVHAGFVAAMADAVRRGLYLFDESARRDVLIQFSAHSLPLSVIDRGDAYPQEVSATVHAVMQQLGFSHPYLLTYQSAVGPVRWQGPNTERVVRALGRQGRRHVLIVPIAFTSDHIETLHEIDIELAEVAHEAGVNLKRAPALNDSPLFVRAMADVVAEHLRSGERCSTQYGLRCPGCVNAECRGLSEVR